MQDNTELTREQFLLQTLSKDSNPLDGLVGIGGIGLGIAIASYLNPILGGVALALTLGNKAYSLWQRGSIRHKVLQGNLSPIALLKNSEEIIQYKEIVGQDEFNQEIGDFIQMEASNGGAYKMISSDTQQLITTEKIARQPQIDVAEELADYCDRHVLILASSGGGKDFLASNAVRVIKKQNPQMLIYVIDPKGDKREAPYYQGVVDVFQSNQCGQLSDDEVLAWFRQQYQEYQAITNDPDKQCLLIITETTLLGEACDRKKDKYFAEVMSKQITTGSSYGNYVWVFSQSPNLADLGFTNNSRSQLNIFAITHEKSIASVEQWQRTKVVKKIKQVELRLLCDNSPCDRALYTSATGDWHPMPKLTNYSLFDRDTRTRINPGNTQQQTVIQSESPTVLQNDPTEQLLLFLSQSETTDIVEAVKTAFPDVPNDKMNEVVGKIKSVCSDRNRQDILSKFSL